MSAAAYIWLSLTVGWGGSVEASAGPLLVLARYDESLDATRLHVELAPCTLVLADKKLSFESSLNTSILGGSK